MTKRIVLSVILLQASLAVAYEISGSPFATDGAPLPRYIRTTEKTIMVSPGDHAWGAYSEQGKLVRWGIATAGAPSCEESSKSCRTHAGYFRIYSLGNSNCVSNKYDDASMPYCMYFNGGQALHGSSDVQFENISHGCVRMHIDDAKWLRHHFVEGPTPSNQYRGTRVIIKAYE